MRKVAIFSVVSCMVFLWSCASVETYGPEPVTNYELLYNNTQHFDVAILNPSSIGINSAGGVNLNLYIFNNTQKIIKYLYISVLPYNAVDDAQTCTIRGDYYRSCQLTGPLNPFTGENHTWECVWYNSTIRYVKITGIYIQYMDGSTKSSKGYDLNRIVINSNKIEVER
jgi:hypothetical protein